MQVGLAQLGIEIPARLHFGTQRIVKERVIAAADRLRPMERHVDARHQLLGPGAVLGCQRDTGTGTDEGGRAAEVEWFLESLEHGLDDTRDAVGIAVIGHQENELIATQAVEFLPGRKPGSPAVRHVLEQPITGRMPHGVVDLVEAVEVEQGERYVRSVRTAVEQRFEVAVEGRSIGEPG